LCDQGKQSRKQEHIRQKTQGNPMAGTAGNVIDGNGFGADNFSLLAESD